MLEDIKLRLTRVVDEDKAYDLSTDFNTLGLRKESPEYDIKGRKIKTIHTDPATDDLVVERLFVDKDDGIEITFNWYQEDGAVGMTKTEFKPMSDIKWRELKRKRRQRVLTAIEVLAVKRAQFLPVLMKIKSHYSALIEEWRLYGTERFKQQLEEETDTAIMPYLDTTIDNQTVREYLLARL